MPGDRNYRLASYTTQWRLNTADRKRCIDTASSERASLIHNATGRGGSATYVSMTPSPVVSTPIELALRSPRARFFLRTPRSMPTANAEGVAPDLNVPDLEVQYSRA